jgi:hypothetical protein
MPKDKLPTYYQTHPPELATIDRLKLEDLQPGDDQPVTALFHFRSKDSEHLTGLFRRADAVPLQVKEPA